MNYVLPTGEQLPGYDDGPSDATAASVPRIMVWLTAHRGWKVEQFAIIRDILDALQAVGDAQLVKNATYRLMRRDGADVERLAAWLANNNFDRAVVEADGNPVTAAITLLKILDGMRQTVVQQALEGGVPQTERAADTNAQDTRG